MRGRADVIEIPLSSKKYPGLVALVDDEDAELVAGYVWCPVKDRNTFYAYAHVPGSGPSTTTGKKIKMHRLICPDITGQIDHADRNGLNNQRSNLRPATDTQQNANKGLRSASGFKGVSWNKENQKWQVYIRVPNPDGGRGTRRSLGRFDDPAEAAMAYDRAARELHGEFAYLNFPRAMAA